MTSPFQTMTTDSGHRWENWKDLSDEDRDRMTPFDLWKCSRCGASSSLPRQPPSDAPVYALENMDLVSCDERIVALLQDK